MSDALRFHCPKCKAIGLTTAVVCGGCGELETSTPRSLAIEKALKKVVDAWNQGGGFALVEV